ncbi:hypothetical protein QEJ31_00865 [Pigmentibacter sp. JX0631]|uniref:hypothetical protein n=1 Tax=Pigmentibacter sp. JX0631 TaxID=2976982 RepID=UPI0024684AB6|nr:hypothetical protein [Pigmentibacter sp. JX0631]WGL60154.1 hypothetical protein QEJ31_00865 [Pigmentibacter sp. JX0631]
MRRIVYSVSSFLSCLAIVGCNFKGNTDMQKEGKTNCQKWDAFAAKVGVPGCDQAVSATDKAGLIKNLSEMPKHFAPDGSNYAEVTKLVQNYVSQMATKTQATEIVSVKKLADVLVEAGFDDQVAEVTNPEFISIPYYERDKVAPSDLSAYKTLSGINKKSKFKIYSTKEGKIDTKEFAEGTAYVLIYKLNGSEQKYSSIVTIPDTDKIDEKFKLIMYAHGGDAGLSLPNMARVLQNNLGKGIVAAPSFPGEPICSITTIGGTVANNFKRSCGDAKGNVIKPAVAAEGEKSPLDNDVNSFLGLHNAISKLAVTTKEKPNILSNNVDPNFNLNLDYYTNENPAFRLIAGPKTIGVSDSRGGATLLAAIGRTGIMLKSTLEGGLGNIDIKKMSFLPLFSSAGLFYTPSTLLIGGFRVVTQNMLAGNIYDTSILNALPMIPELKNNSYISDYRLAPIGQDQKELNKLIGWIGASDIVFLAPYISVGMQNWSVVINDIINTFDTVTYPALTANEKLAPVFSILKNLTDETNSDGNLLLKIKGSIEKAHNDKINIKQCNYSEDIANPANKSCSIYNILVKGQAEINLGYEIIPATLPLIQEGEVKNFLDFINYLNIYLKLLIVDDNNNKFNNLTMILGLTEITGLKPEVLKQFINFIGEALFAANRNPNLSFDNPSKDLIDKIKLNLDNFAQLKSIIISLPEEKRKNAISELLKPYLKVLMEKRKSAPGSIIFLHSTQDGVVPYTQSLIAKKAMDTVFDAVYGSTQIPNNPLTSFNISAVGSQLFAFQPEDRFYGVKLGEKTFDGSICSKTDYEGKTASNYNPYVKKCFGNLDLNDSGDGLVAHGDSAVRTARLISEPLKAMSYEANKNDIINSLLYGNQNSKNNASVVDISKQLSTFNFAYNIANKKEMTNIFYPTDCTDPKTGIRYLLNACPPTARNFPLFNRTLFQDGLQKDAIVDARWEPKNKTSSLTPTDIFTLWMESAAVEASKAN